MKSIKKSVSLWKWRGLSLLGRIQIVKTFAIPKFMFRASVIPTSKELIKEVNSILHSFIWNGKDKVKRHALISDIEMGGLKMLDIDSMIGATRITRLKKFLEDYQSTWKTILDKLLSPVRGRFVLHCNFHTSKLKISLPEYHKECYDAWSDFSVMTKKIHVQKGHSKFRLCKDKRFDHGKPFLLVWYQPTCKSRTKIFPHEYYQLNSCRMGFCCESFCGCVSE